MNVIENRDFYYGRKDILMWDRRGEEIPVTLHLSWKYYYEIPVYISLKKHMFIGSLYGKDLKEMNNSVAWYSPSSQIMFSKYHFLLKGNKIS